DTLSMESRALRLHHAKRLPLVEAARRSDREHAQPQRFPGRARLLFQTPHQRGADAPVLIVFFQEEDGIRDRNVTGVQTCALPIFGGKGGGAGQSQSKSKSANGADGAPEKM